MIKVQQKISKQKQVLSTIYYFIVDYLQMIIEINCCEI